MKNFAFKCNKGVNKNARVIQFTVKLIKLSAFFSHVKAARSFLKVSEMSFETSLDGRGLL